MTEIYNNVMNGVDVDVIPNGMDISDVIIQLKIKFSKSVLFLWERQNEL